MNNVAAGAVGHHRRLLHMVKQPWPGLREQRGWRLDYHLATPALAQLARSEEIYKGEKFSDHAPITEGYDLDL